MFEQIEWVRCEERMPEAPHGLFGSDNYLVTLDGGYVDVYCYFNTTVRGVKVTRWQDYEQPIAWAKMPTGWKDGNDG